MDYPEKICDTEITDIISDYEDCEMDFWAAKIGYPIVDCVEFSDI